MARKKSKFTLTTLGMARVSHTACYHHVSDGIPSSSPDHNQVRSSTKIIFVHAIDVVIALLGDS